MHKIERDPFYNLFTGTNGNGTNGGRFAFFPYDMGTEFGVDYLLQTKILQISDIND